MVVRRKPKPNPWRPSERDEAIAQAVHEGGNGSFLVIHEQTCPVVRGRACLCVPQVHKLVRGSA